MTDPHFYPIGTPGQAWGSAELAQWRARQVRQRSYAMEVLDGGADSHGAPARAL